MLTLTTDITQINRVGKATATLLKKFGIETVRDLLFYFPFRYDDFSKITPIDKLQPGVSANIVGQIELIQNKRSPRKRMYITEALINDSTDTIKVIWFNQPFIAKNIRPGDKVSLAGKIEGDFGEVIMKSPVYEKISLFTSPEYAGRAGEIQAIHTQGIVPNYHLTANITQKQIRFLIRQIIGLAKQIKDWLPMAIIKNLNLLTLSEAITKIHFPKNQKYIAEARHRLAFNELFLLQIQNQLAKEQFKSIKAQKIPFLKKEVKKFVDSLPFKLTNAQRQVAWEILQDIGRDKPMARLLEGDVGSGKTVVAVIAMLNVALNNKQAVIMVPTEILAQQHFDSISKLLAGIDVQIALFTRSARKMNKTAGGRPAVAKAMAGKRQAAENKNIPKKKIMAMIKNGDVDIIIGTHALIQENVEFKNLALAIIDEQHRFGVEQRKTLIEKSVHKTNLQSAICNLQSLAPHLLSMTATPIPRSLAMALYGDLDISVINEMPMGRKKITTYIVPENKREKAYDFIRQQIKDGRQVFVICPLIDMSDKLGVKSVKEEFAKLDKYVFPDLSINMLHGRMKAREKEQIMRDFLDNKINIIVSTSVVEVGVDVPNATIMMIEGAERFGLAQLHQFRGRVGRSEHQSYCFLFTTDQPSMPRVDRPKAAEFTDSDVEKSLKRLQAVVKYHDGFALAKMDLRFRGPGEIYGTRQKGFPELKIASLFDYELMKIAKSEAEKLVQTDKSLKSWPNLKEKLANLGDLNYLNG